MHNLYYVYTYGDSMKVYAKRAWLSTGWQNDVCVSIRDGIISTVESDIQPAPDAVRVDTLLPALANLHSHSFQRAMAGMTEFRAKGQDSFWTWRDLMYRFLDHLTPEQMQAIAALTYMEMLEAGYAAVGEFHYVHHQNGGARYDNPAETSTRIMAAADQSGIGLTHLPVLYTYGGANKVTLAGGQLRFGNSTADYATLVERIHSEAKALPDDTRIGIAPHSLRATAPDELTAICTAYPNAPTHIHISEQPAEVRDISAWLGARPVEWLLQNQNVTTNWCLIHATHMTKGETVNLAKSGAVAGLCPITEANLGDGPFNGALYLAENGTFGLGSDSNVRISLTEELRMLEYSQRLRDLQRNVMVKDAGSVGKTLYLGAVAGGAQALDRNAGEIRAGQLADIVAINSQHPHLCSLTPDQIFDGLCFASDDSVVTDTWSAGRHMVQDGHHINKETIIANYQVAISQLKTSIAT